MIRRHFQPFGCKQAWDRCKSYHLRLELHSSFINSLHSSDRSESETSRQEGGKSSLHHVVLWDPTGIWLCWVSLYSHCNTALVPIKVFAIKNETERQKAALCASKTFMFDLLTIKGWGLSVMFAAENMPMKCPFYDIHWNAYSCELRQIHHFLEHFLLISSAAIRWN